MGKRSSTLTGLSKIALEVFNPSPSSTNATLEAKDTEAPSCFTAAAEKEGTNHRPTKKRKTGGTGNGNGDDASWAVPWEQRYDATGLVPHYRAAYQVPDHLKKYFSQRKRYFSLYDSGCLLDEEGWYSVTPERVADQIAQRCRCTTILDAFCGVGGNAIAFAKTCERVIALDTSPTRLALARHNAQIYGVADRIEFILTDYVSFAQSYLSLPSRNYDARDIDVVFLSPPWGGPEYLSLGTNGVGSVSERERDKKNLANASTDHPEYSLAHIQPIHGADLFNLTRLITPNIAYFLPRNMNMWEISKLVPVTSAGNVSGDDDKRGNAKQNISDGDPDSEMIEVEEEWMGTKLKALTCYFGGLVNGQEDRFWLS